MADDKNVKVAQFKNFAAKIDERLDKLETGKADKVSSVSISIPVSAWIKNTDTTTVAAGFAFYADAAVEGLTAENYLDTVLDFASLEPAKTCGMANTATPAAAKIRYLAVSKPESALTATVRMLKGTTQQGGIAT